MEQEQAAVHPREEADERVTPRDVGLLVNDDGSQFPGRPCRPRGRQDNPRRPHTDGDGCRDVVRFIEGDGWRDGESFSGDWPAARGEPRGDSPPGGETAQEDERANRPESRCERQP